MKGFWRFGLAISAGLCLCASTALANVYPSAVVLDTSSAGTTCGTAKVTFVLNENADGDGVSPGLKIEVLNASNAVVRTVNIARALRGTHTFQWDGRDDAGNPLSGTFKFRITATDDGYTTWTQIDGNPATQATHFERPLGVAVNKNPASPNYGKIYVCQATALSTASGRTMQDGIYMLNADITDAGFSDGGVDWSDTASATAGTPLRCVVGPDDHLYVIHYKNDDVYEFSADMSTAWVVVGRSNGNFTSNQWVRGVWVTGTQATGDRVIYLVNSNYNDVERKGVIRYTLGGAATATGLGEQYVARAYFSYYPYDIAFDSAGNCYVSHYRANPNIIAPLAKFAPSTTLPITTPVWEASRTYTYPEGHDICEERGWVAYGHYSDGNVYFFSMADGSFIQNFKSGSRIRDIAFDAAGNVYTVDNTVERLRVWSPPDGPNSKDITTATFTITKNSGGPTITDQPDDVVVLLNTTATFTVTATGSNVTYQWLRNGAVISGATSNVLSFNATAADAGAIYTCRVCDDNGVVVSDPAILYVGVTIFQHPLGKMMCANASNTLSVVAQGVGTLSYQWQKYNSTTAAWENLSDGSGISGTTTSTLTFNPTTTAHAGQYRVIITDSADPANPVTSNAATLTVSTGPTIQHVGYGNGALAVGASHTMTCYASGSGVLSYQWKKDGVPIPGATQASYRITNATCYEHSGLYSCAVTDSCGTTERSTDINGAEARVTVGAGLEVCGNQLDDDCDGLTDCEDPDCNNDPNCIPECQHQPFADADGDGDVDQADFGEFQRCFTGEGGGLIDDSCYCFDRSGDGDVDVEDLLLFDACVSGPSIPADIHCDDYPTGDVVINEFTYDMLTALGGNATDDREFVELYNRGTTPVDISGWLLRASDTVAPPGDNNRDFIIPHGTILNPGDYYVIGSGLVSDVDMIVSPQTDIWENENEALELYDRNRDLKDAVVYNGYLGAVAVGFPEGRIWGRLEMVLGSNMSVSRYLDGLDTNNNGRDFGLRPQTPGASNKGDASFMSVYVPPNVDSMSVGADVPGLLGTFVNARVINPTAVDEPAPPHNPNVIPASPQGGNAIVAWDPAGGGNSIHSINLFNGDGGYDLWVYFDTNPIPDETPGAETTYFGIMGTTSTLNGVVSSATFYPNLPDPEGLLLGDSVTANSSTGLAWVYNKNHGGQTRKLYLVDAKDGGDSSPGTGGQHWSVLATIDMSTVPSGWYRLSLSYNGTTGAVSGTFDTQTFNGTTTPGLVGSFYIGYFETYSTSAVPLTARPPTFDLRQ